MQVRIDPAIEARVRARAAQYGRSIQGEINRALFTFYISQPTAAKTK